MNKIAISLYVIGAFAIIGGFIVGFETYEVPMEGYEFLTEKNYTILFTWIASGIISGTMFFGFAEIIKLLDQQVEQNRKIYEQIRKMQNGDKREYILSTKED